MSKSILFLVLRWKIYSRFISKRKFRVRVSGFRVQALRVLNCCCCFAARKRERGFSIRLECFLVTFVIAAS